MKIFIHTYDNEKDDNGIDKPNVFLGDFKLIDGSLDDYSYSVIVKDVSGQYYILKGVEISFLKDRHNAGTINSIQPLEENYFVKMYKKYCKEDKQ